MSTSETPDATPGTPSGAPSSTPSGAPSGDELRARLAALVAEARAAGLAWDDVAAALRSAADDARRRAGEEGAAEPAADGGEPRSEGLGEAHASVHQTPVRTAKVGPVTLFNEMEALAKAGVHGWRVVGTGSAMHIVMRTADQWEYRRVFASRATGRALEADGWQRFSSGWFPWGYYQRSTGRPAQDEETIGGYLVEP